MHRAGRVGQLDRLLVVALSGSPAMPPARRDMAWGNPRQKPWRRSLGNGTLIEATLGM